MNINIKELPNFIMDTEDEETIINETSFVESPATGFNFLKFSKSDVKEFKFSNLESKGHQRMASGLWFAPDTKYIRNSDNMYYTVEFRKEDLKDALLKYLKSDFANNTKVEHEGDYQDGFISMEHWIYEDENTKSPVFGLSVSDLGYNPAEIKVGSIFKTVFVQNESFWDEMVVTGKVNGFSIGGLFNLKEEKKAFNEYFNKVEIPVAEVEAVSEIKEEVSETVVSADANVLDEGVEVEGEAADEIIEEPAKQIEPTNLEIMNKFVELQSKLENYISENSLLKVNVENKEKELALLQIENGELLAQKAKQEEVITKQTAHLKDSPIKPISPVKSAEIKVTPDKSKNGKMIGNIWVPFD